MRSEEINALVAPLGGRVKTVKASWDSDDPNYAGACHIGLDDTTTISAAYWRLSVGVVATVSSFDHGPGRSSERVDALAELAQTIVGLPITAIRVDPQSGDLYLLFTGNIELCCFRLRRLFEDWEINGPDGLGFWSNQVAL